MGKCLLELEIMNHYQQMQKYIEKIEEVTSIRVGIYLTSPEQRWHNYKG